MNDPSRLQALAVPGWVTELDMPVWVSGPDLTLVYVNSKAERLIGQAWRNRPCYEVVGARDPRGSPLCGENCALRCRLRRKGSLAPVRMLIDRQHGHRNLTVLPIHVGSPPDDGIVHCALEAGRQERLEDYFRNVIDRGQSAPSRRLLPADSAQLTPREQEILELLASGLSLIEVASSLFISYVTVRNHVQHILAKLGVHSIVEAVACDLLSGEPSHNRASYRP